MQRLDPRRPSSFAPVLLLGLGACAGGLGPTAGGGGSTNRPPIAHAGPAANRFELDLVTLDGTRSADPDGDPLTFQWRFLATPTGSSAALDDDSLPQPTFLADRPGAYELELRVRDAVTESAAATVRIEVAADDALRVGPSRALRVPSEAVAVASAGSTVRIDAGTYRGDVAVWSADRLTLVASNGPVILDADGRSAQGKAIWVVRGSDTVVEGITFQNCRVNDGNGAGIRLEGGDFTARDCRFLYNQMGFLCGDLTESDLLFEGCEFGFSQSDGALAHGIYVNKVRSLEMRRCHAHDAIRGHCVKSRARETRILWSRIGDFADGASSYTIDLPDGGLVFLLGNLIHKGASSGNEVCVSFAEEHRGLHPVDELWMAHNTLVSERATALFVRVSGGSAGLRNNLFLGRANVMTGTGDRRGDLVVDGSAFQDSIARDYALAAGSTAIDRGIDPGTARGVSLAPGFEYRGDRREIARADQGAPDVGAFAFVAPR